MHSILIEALLIYSALLLVCFSLVGTYQQCLHFTVCGFAMVS